MSDVVESITARLDVAEAAAQEYVEILAKLREPRRVMDQGLRDGLDYATSKVDPAHVVALVAALRTIVELHIEGPVGSCEECSGQYLPCRTLRTVAAIWPDAT